MSYTRLHKCFKEKLEFLRFPIQYYSLHSLRAGGATAVVNNEVADRLFKNQGCWRFESVKDGLREDFLQPQFSVTDK